MWWWSGPVDGYLRPDQFLDHLTVIKTVSVLHKKGIYDNIFWGDFSLYHQFVWLKTIEIRLVGNTSRRRWAEIRSLPQSLWMGELTR